jgi:hypothetical protein
LEAARWSGVPEGVEGAPVTGLGVGVVPLGVGVPVAAGAGLVVSVPVGVVVGMTVGTDGVGVTEPVGNTSGVAAGVPVDVVVGVGVATVSVPVVVVERVPETSGAARVVVCEELNTVEVTVSRALACAAASAGVSNVVNLVIMTVDSLTVVAGSGSGSRFS